MGKHYEKALTGKKYFVLFSRGPSTKGDNINNALEINPS